MNTSRWVFGVTSLSITLVFGFGSVVLNASESYKQKITVQNKVYQEECGACHVAYPAKLLPKQSWNKIMSDLENHFEENAEVDNDTYDNIKIYLNKHASDHNVFSKFNNLLKNTGTGVDSSLRITTTPYFIRKHDEIPKRMVEENPQVKSFSQCDKCHREASKGDFEEDNVRIPGYRNWED